MKTLFLIWLSLSSGAQAQWDDATIDWIQAYNREHQDCSHWYTPYPGAQTVLNNALLIGQIAARRGRFTLFPYYPGGRVYDIPLETPHFMSPKGEIKPLQIEVWTPPSVKNELVVLLPGVFQGFADAQIYYLIETLLEQGYRVAVLPNSLSLAYLSRHPLEGPASLPEEARIVGEAVRWISHHLRENSRLHLFGMSYGTFLATLALAQDPSLRELVDGQVTLLSMPWRIGRALQKVDALNGQGYGLQALGSVFNRKLVAALGALQEQYFEDQANGFRARQYPPQISEQFESLDLSTAAVRSQLKFLWALEHLTPHRERFSETSLEDRMAHWLSRLDGFERLRIITMKNDLLSDFEDHLELPLLYRSQSHLLIRAEGEHSGYFGESWFKEFLRRAFP